MSQNFFLFLFFTFSLACESNSNCSPLNYCVEEVCIHKSLFQNLTFIEILAFFWFFLCAILTTMAGVGGGELFYPILIFVLGFSNQTSSPLSITIVFFILLIRNLMSITERSIYRRRSIINYDIVLVFSPSITIGTIFGVLINAISSTWLILILLIIVMIINIISTFKKAREIRDKSLKQKLEMDLSEIANEYLNALRAKILELDKSYLHVKSDNEVDELQKSSLLNNNIEISEVPTNEIKTENWYCNQLPLQDPSIRWNLLQLQRLGGELETILAKENRLMNYEKVFLLFLNVSVVIFFTMLRGTNQIDSIIGVTKCSTAYWCLFFAYIPFGLIFMFLVVQSLVNENKWKLESGYVFSTNDLPYDLSTCIIILATGVAIGLLSSILGLGGAILICPVLLKFGIETQEASFTASFCALFSSFTSVVQYFVAGDIKWDYAGTYGLISVAGMFIGLKGILVYLRRKNMMYVITYALVIIMILTVLLNLTSNVIELAADESAWYFKQYCN